MTLSADVLVVGAGPAGSAAATWAARAGHDVLVVDAASFPRDKTCGDGLTPRAIAQLQQLGLGAWLHDHPRSNGIRMIGFGSAHEVPWNGPHLPDFGSAVPRTELDHRLLQHATDAGARCMDGARAVDVRRDDDGRVTEIEIARDGARQTVRCRSLIVADGVRSPLGRMLGRQWHRDTVYGVAARAYADSTQADDPWITSHLELRDDAGAAVAGYGWIFPLGNGQVNVGVGSLSTAKRKADLHLHQLIEQYGDAQRPEFGLGALNSVASAMLPMGGAVSNVAGPNWMLIGDAAACVNPLNGEGIDYGLETARLAVQLLGHPDCTDAWPALLRRHYGSNFVIARRLAALLTYERFLPTFGPIGMRSARIMQVALRVMGNLVTDDDHDLVARAWRTSGAIARRVERRPLWG